MSESNAALKPDSLRDVLLALNRNYVRSVDEADTAWFEANLADDFMNTNPDGAVIDRAQFLAQAARGPTVKNIQEFDVNLQMLGVFVIIKAKTRYLRPDGSAGQGCYTDDWQFRSGRWQCVSAHVSRV